MASQGNFHRGTFERIADDKRERVFAAAIGEFSELGYNAAGINTIARKAGISIGSMYSYFTSKEDLFLAVTEKGLAVLKQVLEEARPREGTVFEVIERLLGLTVRYARLYPGLCKLYLNLSTEELAPFAERLSGAMEFSFRDFYRRLLSGAIERGEVRADLDTDMAAFFIDNLVVMLQLAYASTYYKMRLVQYLGEDTVNDDQGICQRLARLIRRGLA